MTTGSSWDGTDGMLESGYSSVASRVNSKWIDTGASGRGNGYPVKRYPTGGRPIGLAGDPMNGLDKEENGCDVHKGSGQLPVRSSRGVPGRSIKLDGETGNPKGRSCIYSILISVVVCCFLAEALLQGSVMMLWKQTDFSPDSGNLKETDIGGVVEGPERYSLEYKLRFDPWKLKDRVLQQKHSAARMRMPKQSFLRPPFIALVCSNLHVTPDSLYFLSVARGFQALGYELQLFTFEEGPMQNIWQEQGISVEQLHLNPEGLYVDWSKFEGVIINSLDAKHVFTSFLQEPFKRILVIWVILEDTLGKRLSLYERNGLSHLITEWKQAFVRANVVVFPHYSSAMMHTLLDTGNFLVVPGSPKDVWDVKSYMKSHSRDRLRQAFGFTSEDIVLTIVGSPFSYKGVWREHAMVMQSVLPMLDKTSQVYNKDGTALKLLFVGSNSGSSYGSVIQVMAQYLGLKDGSVSYFSDDVADVIGLLWAADVVIYSSLRDEQEFPNVLLQALTLERFILAPNITIIQDFLIHGSRSLLYPAGDFGALSKKVMLSISKSHMPDQASSLASLAHVMKLLVHNAHEVYADLLESVLAFPSGTMLPKPKSEIPSSLTEDWQWELLRSLNENKSGEISLEGGRAVSELVTTLESQLNATINSSNTIQEEIEDLDILTQNDWEEQKAALLSDDLERKEEEQIEERRELLRGSWEDIYKVVKKMERLKNELHERDDGELERTGQPLCIYEPYYGMGASVFVHQNDPTYRGISLISKQRRSGYDDIDAAARLSLLNNTYYQEVLCEFGAFFAIANRIDRVHKNSWIGFQSWRAAGRKVALSTGAEKSLRDAVKVAKHGDTFYFWGHISENENVQPEKSIHQDFWSFCDIVNNNNCRSVFIDVFRHMYGLPSGWASLPPMPVDGGRWSALHCWAMPTSSFLEFVMFSRMFFDALDIQHYKEHHDGGSCCLGVSEFEVKHCYCRLLELLVNVWAYHSARIMVYIDPKTGAMQEQHTLNSRQGRMWVKYFEYNTIKGMDEDLAEEFDEKQQDGSKRRLWPQTGEVYWQGMFERERREHINQRNEKKRKNKERLERIRSRYRQKPLAVG